MNELRDRPSIRLPGRVKIRNRSRIRHRSGVVRVPRHETASWHVPIRRIDFTPIVSASEREKSARNCGKRSAATYAALLALQLYRARVSPYYTMGVTSARAVINYDGSRNHYRGVSCNSGVLSVYIRL